MTMSFPENLAIEVELLKPLLKLKIGDLVVLKTDKKQKRKMTITALLPTGAYQNESADYSCSWITSQGKLVDAAYREKYLKKIEK